MSEIILTIDGVDLVTLFGENNAKLNLVRKAFPDVTITSRGANLKIKGEKTTDTQSVKDKIEMMVKMLRDHKELSLQVVEDMVRGENPYDVRLPANGVGNSTIVYGKDGTPIRAKTRNQKKLVDAIEANDIVFAVGPAGTGKTYTAVAMAVRALKNRMSNALFCRAPPLKRAKISVFCRAT